MNNKKSKNNFIIGILIIFMFLFIYIIFIVYIAFIKNNISSQLISDNYYKDEINYQKIINYKNNVKNLTKKVKINFINNGILILFPYNLKNEIIKVKCNIIRFSDKNLDINKYFILNNNNKIFINGKILIKGEYMINLEWIYKNKGFFLEKKFIYKN